MLSISFVVSILIQLVLPFFIGFYIVRRYHTPWRLIVIGVLAYLVYQVVQMPLFQAIGDTEFYQTQAQIQPQVWTTLVFALLNAILDVAAHAGSLFYVRRTASDWGSGLTLAAGHGGTESALVGVQFLINFIFAILITTNGPQMFELGEAEAAQLTQQVSAFWALEWYLPLAAGMQRLAVLTLAFAVGMMAWLAVSRKAWVWLAAAVFWHAAISSLVAILGHALPDLSTMGAFILLALLNGGLVYFLYRKLYPPEAASQVIS